MTLTSASGMVVDSDQWVPMRDGARLQADIFRPAAPGRYPVLVMRSPYGRAGAAAADYWVPQGYAVLAHDCRGRFGSEGEYYPIVDEGDDGYDTVEWAAVQPWSDGNVGTIGQSYLGAVQNLLAPKAPPHLYAASSAYDTDFTAKLVEVRPDGYAENLIDGIIRARYRESGCEQRLLRPGQVYPFTIDRWATSHVFQPGHRIRLEVRSSNFPRFDRNLNTGRPIATETELLPARRSIYHDARHPSCIMLPVRASPGTGWMAEPSPRPSDPPPEPDR